VFLVLKKGYFGGFFEIGMGRCALMRSFPELPIGGWLEGVLYQVHSDFGQKKLTSFFFMGGQSYPTFSMQFFWKKLCHRRENSGNGLIS
jgi:hypothetical protein